MILSTVIGAPSPHMRTILGLTGENIAVTTPITDLITSGGSVNTYSLYSKIEVANPAEFTLVQGNQFTVDPVDGTVTYHGGFSVDPFVIIGRFIVNLTQANREMAITPFVSRDGGATWRIAGLPTMFEHSRNNRDSTQSVEFSLDLNTGDKIRFAVVQNDGQSISDMVFKSVSIGIH